MRIITLLFALFSIVVNAQVKPTFFWSAEPTTIENESEYKIDHIYNGTRLFKIKTKYNEKVFNTDILVDIFDSKDEFEKDESNNLSVEQPLMGLNMLTHNNMFYLSDRDYVQFLDEYNRTSRENELFFQKINVDTGSKTRLQLVTKMPGKNGSNPGEFYTAQSDNKMFYVVLKQPSYDKKVNEKITLCLLDDKYKTIKELEYEFPFSSKQSGDQSLYVSNTGNVFIIKNIDLPKMKPYMSAYFWNTKANTVTEKSLKLEFDYLQINQYKGQFANDDFYLQGFYSDGARVISLGTVDASPCNGIFAAKFNATTGDVNYFTSNKVERYKNMYLKDFIIEGNKTWMLLDQVYKTTERLPSPDKSKPFDYTYNYKYDSFGITFGMIDNTTGKLDWINDIKNPEPSTTNDNGVFFSCLYFLKNNTISVLYNDTRDLNSRGGINIVYNSRVPVLQTYDATGKMIQGYDITDPGVGGTKKHCFELDTSFKVAVDENTFIVRTKCGNRAKYGYLKI